MATEKQKYTAPPNAAGNLKMDYGQADGDQPLQPEQTSQEPPVGLSGGQARGDKRGLDISAYTGPGSKASNDLDPEQALGGTHHQKEEPAGGNIMQ